MTPSLRELIAAIAAVVCGALAAFVATPILGINWSFSAELADTEKWIAVQSNTVAIGGALAVPVCVLLASRGSRQLAWGAAAGFALIVGIATLILPDGSGIDAQGTYYLRALAAGGLIGAAVAASWGRRALQLALVLGVVATWLIVWMREAQAFHDVFDPAARRAGDPWWWLVALAIVAAAAAAATAHSSYRAPHPGLAGVQVAIAGVISFVVVNRLLGAWLTNVADSPRPRLWTVTLSVVALIFVLVFFISRMTPGTDGRFVLTMTGITAAAMPVVCSAHGLLTREVDLWVGLFVGILAVAIGLRAAIVVPHPVAGLAVAGLVPLLGALWPEFGTGDAWIVLRLALLGLGAGHAIGSNFASESPITALGLVIPFTALALSRAYTIPLVGATEETGDYGLPKLYGDPELFNDNAVAIVMTVFVGCCAAAILTYRPRPATPGHFRRISDSSAL
ncbi:hypothetical protein [Antrihabitans sp. YC2-6]|uniref:hypothetical protein n=1 Tax=Antrihabitans sp. YC2-6 TaxID=2799498 RepID=UPI0018F4B2D3|nr:hypothetical protein [Antrihabitans sp. YC2-6]MBJ8348600.1 hypothetical protein [Antrihabitans sp. YC2-6]